MAQYSNQFYSVEHLRMRNGVPSKVQKDFLHITWTLRCPLGPPQTIPRTTWGPRTTVWEPLALWLEQRTSNRENPGSSCCRFKPWAILLIPHCLSSLSCINEYLAIDSGGYIMWMNSLRAVIATWINAPRRSWCWNEQVCYWVKCKASCATDWISRYMRTYRTDACTHVHTKTCMCTYTAHVVSL